MKVGSLQTKLILILFLIVIASSTIYYNYYLLSTLKEKERSSIELWASAIEYNGTPQHEDVRQDLKQIDVELNQNPLLSRFEKNRIQRQLQRIDAELENSALNFVATEIIIKNRFEVPSVVADTAGNILYARNIKEEDVDKSILKKFESLNAPIRIKVGNEINNQIQLVYYGESRTITLLTYFPFIQLGLLALFIGLAYYSWSTVRESEQSNLWVGMAKEAAHQLGTPLSSLYGWITLMKNDQLTQNQLQEIILELSNDTDRMQKVAERFNKIGSLPELKEQRIEPIVNQVLDYLEPRIPRLNKGVRLVRNIDTVAKVKLNSELFEWAIENVVKNAIDAIVPNQPDSYVKVECKQIEKEIIILIEDTGKGIEKKHFADIFKPGYSTKKRGWGLGLSLTKRIIEEYHQGSIQMMRSELGKGTLFQIILKIDDQESA